MVSRLERLNLKRNLFGSPSLDEWPLLAVVDEAHFLSFLAQPGRRVIQFMGECGRGKSTHMRVLHAHYPNAPYLYFGPQDHPKIPRHAPIVFLDETQRIPWLRRQFLWRQHQTFVIGTHRNHQKEFERAHVHMLHHDVEGLDESRLRQIIDRRLAWAIRDPRQPSVEVTPELITGVLAFYGDDIRAIFSLLYEVVQSMNAPGPIPWPPPSNIALIEPSHHLRPGEVRTYTSYAQNS